MDCKTCKEIRTPQNVPYVAHEAAMARMERSNKRLWVALLIAVCIIAGMFVYEAQFETVVTEQDVIQDAENGENRFVGGNVNGLSENTD